MHSSDLPTVEAEGPAATAWTDLGADEEFFALVHLGRRAHPLAHSQPDAWLGVSVAVCGVGVPPAEREERQRRVVGRLLAATRKQPLRRSPVELKPWWGLWLLTTRNPGKP